jgi:hypothetical protein
MLLGKEIHQLFTHPKAVVLSQDVPPRGDPVLAQTRKAQTDREQ